MKFRKFLLSIFTLFFFSTAFAQEYRIISVNYDIKGCGWKIFGKTNPYALSLSVPVDTKRIFSNEDEYNAYITDYKVRLNNTRVFEKIDIQETKEPSSANPDLYFVTLNVRLKDSFHLLIVPYPKYDSNNGLNLKLKMKDMNFLGSLNPLSADIYCLFSPDGGENEYGITFDFDLPYKAKIFDLTWVNDFAISYSFGDESPEWKAKTGIKAELPKGNITPTLEFYQIFANDLDYTKYDDNMYFSEQAKFSVPVTITKINNIIPIKYTPYVSVNFNWDIDGINQDNRDLLSPEYSIGQTLSTSRINWDENFRNGFSLKLTNSFNYNTPRNLFYPSVSAEGKYYKSFIVSDWNIKGWQIFNRMGFTTDIYAFADIINMDPTENKFWKADGTKVGGRLRGIRDNINFDTGEGKATRTNSAIVINMDFPFQVLRTNFEHNLINFECQFSPFIDIGLGYNKHNQSWFDPKDGFYCGGLEVLVYPKKLSSFTIRGSLGIDLGRFLLKDKLNDDWRGGSKYEISFGIGLFY